MSDEPAWIDRIAACEALRLEAVARALTEFTLRLTDVCGGEALGKESREDLTLFCRILSALNGQAVAIKPNLES